MKKKKEDEEDEEDLNEANFDEVSLKLVISSPMQVIRSFFTECFKFMIS